MAGTKEVIGLHIYLLELKFKTWLRPKVANGDFTIRSLYPSTPNRLEDETLTGKCKLDKHQQEILVEKKLREPDNLFIFFLYVRIRTDCITSLEN